jgi:hypothetical protein
MKYLLQLFTITFLLNTGNCKAQFSYIANPWGFSISGTQSTYAHHFFDVDTNQSLDHVFMAETVNSSDFYMNFNKASTNTTPNFANCSNENFLSYWDITDSLYGQYIPNLGGILLGSTSKFFDLDNDGDKDMISSAIADDTINPNNQISAYMVNENKHSASPYLVTGYTCLYNYIDAELKYNLPFKVSNDTLAIHIFDIGHITKPTSKDIIALELGKPNKAQFVLYQDISTSNSPSYLPRQNNPFGLQDFTANDPKSMPLLIDADVDGDNDILVLAGQSDTNLTWYYYQNTGTASSPNFSTPMVTNPYGLTNVNASNTQDNLIVLYKIDGNFDGKDDIIFGSDKNIFYFENQHPVYPTSVDEATNTINELSIFPNPALDKINLTNISKEVVYVKIIDNYGKIINNQKISNAISVQDYPCGVYQIFLLNNTNNTLQKSRFIKLLNNY